MNSRLIRTSLFICAGLAAAPLVAHADTFSSYQIQPARQFLLPNVSLPGQAQGSTLFDVLGDGRILAVATRDSDEDKQSFSSGTPLVYIQQSVGSATFNLVGELELAATTWYDFGGSFLAVSPGGTRAAVGNNDASTGIFSTTGLVGGGPAPAVAWHEVPAFGGAWFNEQLLGLTVTSLSGTGEVSIFNADTGISATVITGLNAPAGIAFDAVGNLYTAEGFGSAFPTGQIRRFTKTAWQNAQSTGTPLGFSTGTIITQFLSATSLGFDTSGNLVIGGGLFSNRPASNGIEVFRLSDSAQRVFDPNTVNNSNGNFYVTAYNRITGEIYVNEPLSLVFGGAVNDRLVHVISAPLVPEPAGILLAAVGIVGLVPLIRVRLNRKGF